MPAESDISDWSVTIRFRDGVDRFDVRVGRDGALDAAYATMTKEEVAERIRAFLDPRTDPESLERRPLRLEAIPALA